MPGETLRRRKLGKELKRHRDAAGMTITQVAKGAHLQPGTISKIEHGKQAILPRNVKLILQACGVGAPVMDTMIRMAEESDDVGWWVSFSDTMPDWFATYVDLESDAEEIWTYTPELVDGLLQTPEYAEAVARAAFPDITKSDLKRSVELRTARQEQLDRPQPARLRIVLNEAVIRRPVGSEQVMRAQMRHLATLGKRRTIDLHVLPFIAGAHPGMKGPFTMLRFPEGYGEMDCVYLENDNGEVWQERPNDITRYTEVFTRMRRMALSQADTLALLTSLG